MNTSYFAKKIKFINPVSIAGKCPDWYKGKEFKKLAPKYWFFKKYKEDHDKKFYTEMYYKEVLNLLDPKTIYEELGENSTLLCWEKSGSFCHRRLIANWLEINLNIKVPELS